MEAVKIANELFQTSKFQTYKKLENKLEIMKKEFKLRMGEDEKRREFVSQNLVLKYIKDRVYDVDVVGMNETLYQHGLIVDLSKINTKDQSALNKIGDFKNPQTYQLRINTKIEKEEYDFSERNITDLVDEYNMDHIQYKRLNYQIEKARVKIFGDENLQKDMKAEFEFGSLSLAKNKITYNIKGIYENLGAEFIIENSSPNLEKLEEYMIKGIINKSEIQQFKMLKDIRLKFVVISLTDEELVFSMMHKKTQGLIQESLREVATTMEG